MRNEQIQPFAGLLYIIAVSPRMESGAIDIKSFQDFKKHFIIEKLKLSIWDFCQTPQIMNILDIICISGVF